MTKEELIKNPEKLYDEYIKEKEKFESIKSLVKQSIEMTVYVYRIRLKKKKIELENLKEEIEELEDIVKQYDKENNN